MQCRKLLKEHIKKTHVNRFTDNRGMISFIEQYYSQAVGARSFNVF